MPYQKIHIESYSNFGGINAKASRYLTNQNEALQLVNMDFSRPGSLTKRPGTTLLYGTTLVGRIGGLYEFTKLNGASYNMVAANTVMYAASGNSLNPIRSGLTNNGIFDFVTFVDRLFTTNGSELFKFNGTDSYPFSLPSGPTLTSATPAGAGASMVGTYTYAYGYLNESGYFGPAANTLNTVAVSNERVDLAGITTPTGFGITAIVIYRGLVNESLFRIGYATPPATTFSDTNLPELTDAEGNFIPLVDSLYFTMAPQHIELFNNQLFLIGFSSAPSTAFWSEIGKPESILPEYSAEFRTNDGDKLTAAKAYGGQLVVTKQRSVHVVSGEDPANFSFREITDQYGCISKRAIATFNQRCWFLDSKGVCEFNGANTDIVSNKVEEIFDAMNIDVASELAIMQHVKERNEVWTAIPTNGATFLNTIVCYDYDVGAWWTIEGVNVSSLNVFKGAFDRPTVEFGGYSGTVGYFGSSLFQDGPNGMTLLVQFPYSNAGHSVEQQWRRLWVDVDPQLGGITKILEVKMFSDQGSTAMLHRTLTINEFQDRIDYGIPAKDLSVQFIHNSDSPLRLNGYSLAHRYQRDV